MQADKVESVIALVDSYEVLSFSELVFAVLFGLFELLVDVHQIGCRRLISLMLLQLLVVFAEVDA